MWQRGRVLDGLAGIVLAFADHGVKSVFVVGKIGTHNAVPKIKVQAVVAGKFAVVHIVVGGGVNPFKHLAARKPLRIQLKTRMKINGNYSAPVGAQLAVAMK